MTCHKIYIVIFDYLQELIYIMESAVELIPIEEQPTRKETMLIKRLKAKEKLGSSPSIVVQTKQDVRKERNRSAAQKSRDKKKNYLQNLEQENMKLKDIISRCEICSAEAESQLNSHQNHSYQSSEKEQVIPITHSPPAFAFEAPTFIRQDHFNDESSASNLSKYFWFGCLVVLVCMASFQQGPSQTHEDRTLIEKSLPSIKNSPIMTYIETTKNQPLSVLGQSAPTALMTKKQINYCRKCIECLQNITNNQTIGQLSLVGNLTLENQTSQNSTKLSKILFCKSKAKFFHKIYEALANSNDKDQKNSRQITRVLIKGRSLNELMQEDCFSGEPLDEEKQYIISFSLAILEMTPVKAKRPSRLTLNRD